MTWIDILILIIIGICILEGLFRGLIKSAFGLIKYILSFFIAKFTAPYLASWLSTNTSINENLQEFLNLRENIPSISQNATDGINSIDIWFNGLNLGSISQNGIKFFTNLWNTGAQATRNLGASAIDKTTSSILHFLSFIVIFIIVLIISAFLIQILDLVSKLPVIDTFNRIGGFIFGLLKGLIISTIIVSILFIIALILKDSPMNTAFRDSLFATYFYIGYILM